MFLSQISKFRPKKSRVSETLNWQGFQQRTDQYLLKEQRKQKIEARSGLSMSKNPLNTSYFYQIIAVWEIWH